MLQAWALGAGLTHVNPFENQAGRMNLIKSIGVGLLSVVMAFVVVFVGVLAYLFLAPSKDGVTVGWDPVCFVKSPSSWIIVLTSFALGFLWEYRRLLRR